MTSQVMVAPHAAGKRATDAIFATNVQAREAAAGLIVSANGTSLFDTSTASLRLGFPTVERLAAFARRRRQAHPSRRPSL